MPFELAIDPSTLIILAVVAFLASFIDAIAGGGGAVDHPALLTAGVPHLALGTNKLSSTFGAATASYTFYRRKLFHPGWRNALLATAIGAAIGAWAAHLLPAEWLNRMLPVVVFTCGLYMLFGGTPKAPLNADAPVGRKRQWPQGLALASTTAWRDRARSGTVSSLLMYPLDLAAPACGAEHELRQQHSGAGGVRRLRPGDLVARPVHGCVADGRRLFRRAHRHRRGESQFILFIGGPGAAAPSSTGSAAPERRARPVDQVPGDRALRR